MSTWPISCPEKHFGYVVSNDLRNCRNYNHSFLDSVFIISTTFCCCQEIWFPSFINISDLSAHCSSLLIFLSQLEKPLKVPWRLSLCPLPVCLSVALMPLHVHVCHPSTGLSDLSLYRCIPASRYLSSIYIFLVSVQ